VVFRSSVSVGKRTNDQESVLVREGLLVFLRPRTPASGAKRAGNTKGSTGKARKENDFQAGDEWDVSGKGGGLLEKKVFGGNLGGQV